MNALKYWLKAILIDAAIVVAFVAWKGYGIEGAGNAMVTWLWFISVLGILIGLVADKDSFPQTRPAGFSTYHWLTDVALFTALAFYGMPGLAVTRFVAAVGVEAARNREPKQKN